MGVSPTVRLLALLLYRSEIVLVRIVFSVLRGERGETLPVCSVQAGLSSWEKDKCLSWWPWGRHSPNMSRATKRKHVTREVEQDLTLPQPGQQIVKVRTPTVSTSPASPAISLYNSLSSTPWRYSGSESRHQWTFHILRQTSEHQKFKLMKNNYCHTH